MWFLLAACGGGASGEDPSPDPVDTDPVVDSGPGTDSGPVGDSGDSTVTDTDTGGPVDPCTDGRDNDGDAWIDAADPDCAEGDERGLGTAGCNDGVDNDLDGDIDGYDDDCDAAGDDEGDPGLVGEVPLSAADLILRGSGTDDGLGDRVSAAGDLDGDGIGELLLTVNAGGVNTLRWYPGDLRGEHTGDVATGEVRATDGAAPLGAFLDADVDGDGALDLLVGSPGGDGAVFVLHGPLAPGAQRYDEAPTQLLGTPESGTGSGLVWGGDLTGDGADDLVVGANSPGELAAVIVAGPLPEGVTDLDPLLQRVVFDDAGDGGPGGGIAVADLDGDGTSDLALGAPAADDVHADHGRVYVVPGPVPTGEIDLRFAWGSWVGEDAHHAVGRQVLVAGDVNTDGLPDLFVGMGANDSYGTIVDRAYLLYAAVGRGEASLADASVIFEGDAMFDRVGHPLAAPGDVDGDTRADVLLSASASDVAGRDAGLGYLFYGAIAPGTYTCDRARATFFGEAPDGQAGSALGGADLDGDGFAEVVIGAAALGQGSVYLFGGKER